MARSFSCFFFKYLGDASDTEAEKQWSKQENIIKALEGKYRWKLNEHGVSIKVYRDKDKYNHSY